MARLGTLAFVGAWSSSAADNQQAVDAAHQQFSTLSVPAPKG